LFTHIRGVHDKFPVTRPDKIQIYSLLPAPVYSSVFGFIIRNFIIVIPPFIIRAIKSRLAGHVARLVAETYA